MSLVQTVGKAVFRPGSSLSAVQKGQGKPCPYNSYNTHPSGSNTHGCLTLHFAENGNERRAKPLKATLPTAGSKSNMTRIAVVLCMLVFMTGCAGVPFKKAPDESYTSADPAAVRTRFQESIPAKLRLLNTIVFEYNWKTFSGIGFVDVDTAERACSLVCINQMGMKLFELSIDKDSINTLFALPEFTAKGDFGKMVGEDIRRIYFDLVPAEEAEVHKKKFSLVFRQQEGKGTAEYVFSGPDRYLTEKTYYENGTPVWQVSFYEYLNKDGKIYPGGTILKNYTYGYRLIIRLKEVSD